MDTKQERRINKHLNNFILTFYSSIIFIVDNRTHIIIFLDNVEGVFRDHKEMVRERVTHMLDKCRKVIRLKWVLCNIKIKIVHHFFAGSYVFSFVVVTIGVVVTAAVVLCNESTNDKDKHALLKSCFACICSSYKCS